MTRYRIVQKVTSLVPLGLRVNFEILVWKWFLRNFDRKATTQTEFKKHVLIATNLGNNLNTLAFDLILALALRSVGHQVTFTLCDRAVGACMNCELNKFRSTHEFVKAGSSKLCKTCVSRGEKILRIGKFKPHKFTSGGGTITKAWDLEVASSGAKRFLAIGRVRNVSEYESVLEKFMLASQRMNFEFTQILDSNNFDLILAHHGIYVPQGNVVALARERGIPLVTWVQGYRKGTFVFGFGDTYHKTFLKEEVPLSPLPNEIKLKTLKYLKSRDTGKADWISFGKFSKHQTKVSRSHSERQSVLLLTNVSWDAQLHYDSRVFLDMHDWIIETVNWFIANPEFDLTIRVHPAELTGRIVSQDPVASMINETFGNLPTNIELIGPGEKVSTYALMDRADLGLIFASKVGIELATLNVPIIVAGESWIRGRGFSNDPKTKEEYFELLRTFLREGTNLHKNQELALSFAHWYFFTKSIEVKSVKPISIYPYMRPKLSNTWRSDDEGLERIIKEITVCARKEQ